MSTRTQAPALTLDTRTVEQVTALIQEATNGRANDGHLEQIRIGDITLDGYASRSWGVGFTRTIGSHTHRADVAAADLTVASVAEAITGLVNL